MRKYEFSCYIYLKKKERNVYRVTLVVAYIGWDDLHLGSSPGWWATTVATYCPSRMVEPPKPKSTQPRYATTRVTL